MVSAVELVVDARRIIHQVNREVYTRNKLGLVVVAGWV